MSPTATLPGEEFDKQYRIFVKLESCHIIFDFWLGLNITG